MGTKDKNTLEELDSVSKRLKYIVDTMGVKQSHMAEKLGVSPSGLHYILNNDVKFSKNAKKIADYLNVNEQWLATGRGEIYEENTSIKTYKVPIYYPDQLKLHYKTNLQSQINTSNFFVTTIAHPNKMLAIYMTESDFSPKFEVGDILSFEETNLFHDGEVALVYLHKTNTITIKYVFHSNDDIVLISQNEKPSKLEEQAGDKLIGMYRECLKRAHTD